MIIDKIKKEFPIFDEKIQNNDLVYLDSANSSQKPKIVTDKINEFYTKQFSNVGRSVHYLAVARRIYMKIQDRQFKNILMLKIKMRLFLLKEQLRL